MERKTCLETDSAASVCVCVCVCVWERERKRERERNCVYVCLCCFWQVIHLCFFFLLFSCSLCGYLLSWSVWSWCPPSGMRIACISEYFHLRLHLLESADKCIYIIYTNSGRVKAGLTHLQTGGLALQAKLQVRIAMLRSRDRAGLLPDCDRHP